MEKINSFCGEYEFLSNFYYSPFKEQEIFYPTVEHYFQAQKAKTVEERKKIAAAPTPGKAKRLGRKVTLIENWEQVKEDVMYNELKHKFSNPILLNKLLNTGEIYLEEGNYWHDNYWGVCFCNNCQNNGKNTLGKLLMRLRKENK